MKVFFNFALAVFLLNLNTIGVLAQGNVAAGFPTSLCKVQRTSDADICRYETTDGVTHILVMSVLVDDTKGFARSIGVSSEQFRSNTRGYLRAALKSFHRKHWQKLTPRGWSVKTNTVKVQARSRNPKGLQECIVYDFDVVNSNGKERSDNRGMRCMAYDDELGIVGDVMVNTQWHHSGNTDRRMPGFEKEANSFMRSLVTH